MKKTLMLVITTLLMSFAVHAQNVKLIIPVPPGGTTDNIARALGQAVGNVLNVEVTPFNFPGVNSTLGIRRLIQETGPAFMVSQAVPFMGTESIEDIDHITPVHYLGPVPETLMVRPNFPLNNVNEIAKTTTRVVFACIGDANMPRFLINKTKNTNIDCVPYKGAPQATVDVMGGHVDGVTLGLAAAMRLADSGKVKVLGYTGHRRSPLAPNIPTFEEQGLTIASSMVFYVWANNKIGAEQFNRVTNAINTAVRSPEFQAKLKEQGIDPEPIKGSVADHFKNHMKDVYNLSKK